MRRAQTVTCCPIESGFARCSGKVREASSNQLLPSAPSRSGVAGTGPPMGMRTRSRSVGPGELQFLDRPAADVREPGRDFSGRELDFLGPDYRDDLARRDGLGAGPLEAKLVSRAVAEQQVGGAEERRDEARTRARVKVIGTCRLRAGGPGA